MYIRTAYMKSAVMSDFSAIVNVRFSKAIHMLRRPRCPSRAETRDRERGEAYEHALVYGRKREFRMAHEE
jgi:hypothetical protein